MSEGEPSFAILPLPSTAEEGLPRKSEAVPPHPPARFQFLKPLGKQLVDFFLDNYLLNLVFDLGEWGRRSLVLLKIFRDKGLTVIGFNFRGLGSGGRTQSLVNGLKYLALLNEPSQQVLLIHAEGIERQLKLYRIRESFADFLEILKRSRLESFRNLGTV